MKNLLKYCLLALVIATITSSVYGEEAIFNAHWVKKEYQPYQLIYQNYTTEKGDTVAIETLSLRADVLVMDSLSKGYVMQWKMHDFNVETNHYMSRQWVASLKKCQLKYTVSREGVITEVTEAKDFDKMLDRTIDVFFKNYPGETVLLDRERLYLFRENMESCIFSMVQQFHQAHGMGYTLGEVVEVPTEVELSLSHKPVNATIFKKFESMEDSIATLVTATVLDTAQVNQAVRTYVPLMESDTTAFSLPVFRQENSGALMMHLPTGWPVFVYDCREICTDNKIIGEYMEMSLLK